MEARSLGYIAASCGGQLLRGQRETLALRVCTDSRTAQPGDVFFPLRGENFDAHNFIAEAIRRGATAVVAERRRIPIGTGACGVIGVDDTRKALGLLAGAYRKEFALPVAAVGGSNGKTTTKELAASVLRQKFVTLSSEGSFNNDIGVPLTLLKLERAHQAAVLEAGTNHPGELEPLVRLIAPRYGLITTIGREHLEFFVDLAGVVREEGCLAELLPADGKLFIAGDNQWADRIRARTRAAVVKAGFSPENDWRAVDVRMDAQGVTFRAIGPSAEHNGEYRIRLLGRHQVLNALLALALGAELGVGREGVARGLAETKPAKMRMELWESHDVQVLDDCYNANADSMLAALRTLRELPCRGRRVAVLGDMAEQGASAAAAHEEVGREAAELGVGQLFAVGKMAAITARAARAAGLNRVLEFAELEAAAAALRSFLKSGDLVLLKASRSARLERISALLRVPESGRGA